MKFVLIYGAKRECWSLWGQKKNCWIQSLRRQRLPAPILIGQWPCHKLLAKCLCVLERGCVVYICACLSCGRVCMCLRVCVLDRWAGDSDRLVCSQRFSVSGSESSSSYSYGCLRHACTHPITHTCTHAGVYTCMHSHPSLQIQSHIHTWAQCGHTHSQCPWQWQGLRRTNWHELKYQPNIQARKRASWLAE